MSKVQGVFRSRWGFHPCDYETYCKLKFLNLAYQKAVRLAHAWRRWQRKDPHNRVSRRRVRNSEGWTVAYEPPVPLPEPKSCPVFSQKVFEKRHGDQRGHFSREGFLVEKVVTDDRGIPDAYASARKPVANQADVQPLRLSAAELEELCREARTWLEEQDLG